MTIDIQKQYTLSRFQALRNRDKTERIIIHHAASSPDATMEQEDAYHRSLGWACLGYHYFIEQDGKVKIGRPDWAVGAHAINANYDSLGVCLAGNFEITPPTSSQMDALAGLILDIRRVYGNIPYQGHNTVDPVNHPTACPGALFPWDDLAKRLEVNPVEITTVADALRVLQAKGIINSPEYWKSAEQCVRNLDTLLINFANYIKQGRC